MKQQMPSNLQEIYELELALGNTVARIDDSGQAALPSAIIFVEPLHRANIETQIEIVPPIKWYTVGNFGGYLSEDTLQSVQGPILDVADNGRDARQKLSPELQSIYDLELALGNAIVRVDEPAGSLCPLAIIFRNPLHKGEIDSTLSPLLNVKWWESRDPHYPIEGGYKCDESAHVLAGPLR